MRCDSRTAADRPETVDLPDLVIGFLHGELGTPPGGFPEPFRSKAIEGRTWEPRAEELHRDGVAVIEAMKMESTTSAPIDGTVERVVAIPGASLEGGDLILEIRPSGLSSSPETSLAD